MGDANAHKENTMNGTFKDLPELTDKQLTEFIAALSTFPTLSEDIKEQLKKYDEELARRRELSINRLKNVERKKENEHSI